MEPYGAISRAARMWRVVEPECDIESHARSLLKNELTIVALKRHMHPRDVDRSATLFQKLITSLKVGATIRVIETEVAKGHTAAVRNEYGRPQPSGVCARH